VRTKRILGAAGFWGVIPILVGRTSLWSFAEAMDRVAGGVATPWPGEGASAALDHPEQRIGGSIAERAASRTIVGDAEAAGA
jgi:hypothetical protein